MVGLDKLLNDEEARRAFMKFRKNPVKRDNECSLMHLVRFGAIIPNAFNSVRLFLDELDNCLMPCALDCHNGLSSKQNIRKGGVRPQKAAERLRNLFPVAAENLLQHCYQCIVDDLVEEGKPIDTELSAVRTGTNEEGMNNLGRCYTTAFRYSRNG